MTPREQCKACGGTGVFWVAMSNGLGWMAWGLCCVCHGKGSR